jgi:hypothetical protein
MRGRPRRRVISLGSLRAVASVVSALATGTVTLCAHADPADEKAAAQVLFDQGRALVERGDFEGACPKFAESQRIDPGLGTILWLADCYENDGKTASAWGAFMAAAGTAALRHDERERIARERAANLEPKLVRLRIGVPADPPPGLAIRRDGMMLGNAEWGVAVPVDPGTHVVTATAPGRSPWSTSIRVSEADGLAAIAVPELDPVPVAALTPKAPRSAATEATVTSRPDGTFQRAAGLGVGGAGVAALLAGAFVSLRAKATYDESNAGTAPHCLSDNECDAAGKAYRSQADSLATVATIAMTAGLVGAVGGAVLYFTAPSAAPRAVAVAPLNGAAGGTVRVRWEW